MDINPGGMLPAFDLKVFAWVEDAMEWLRERDYDPLDLLDGSERGYGTYVVHDGYSTTCLLWFDVDVASFNVTKFSGVAAAASMRLIRHVYAPFFSDTTPCDDVLCTLLNDVTSAAVFGVGSALMSALDVANSDLMPGAIPRDDPWVVRTDPPVHHVPSNFEMVAIYQSWQMGSPPCVLAERFGVDEDIIFSECERIRKLARTFGLRTV